MTRPTVVMLTINRVAYDARVRKAARSLVEAGWDVTVVGRSSSARSETSSVGGARLIEVPVSPAGEDWRARHLPRFETFDALIDALQPDVVHAHAIQTVGVAMAAKDRARREGRDLKVVYDAHEYVDGVHRPDPTWRLAMLTEEDRYIGGVDGVITVSDPLAEQLQRRYALPALAAVVKNAPEMGASLPTGRQGIRAACGLGPSVPLLVYSGAVAPARGVDTVVAALTALPDVHFALQVAERHGYVVALEAQAQSLHVADRVHVLPYVPAEDVVTFVGSATAGVIPLLHAPNHEVALTNKYLEFMHARLPILTSDVKLQAELTAAWGNGEVFQAHDVASLVDAVDAVLAAPARYAAAYETPGLLEANSWEAQVPALLGLYERVTGVQSSGRVRARRQAPRRRPASAVGTTRRSTSRRRASRPFGFVVGPANIAGQGWAWAKALERHAPGIRTEVFSLERDSVLQFPSDHLISQEQWLSPVWHVAMRRHIAATHTHVLLEAGMPVAGHWSGGSDFNADVHAFRDAGLEVGLVFHGGEIRSPRRHRQVHPDSPFADPDESLTATLQRKYDDIAARLQNFAGPLFATTPDLLDDLPAASWLPITIDTAAWSRGPDVMQRETPVVLHAPSLPHLKGSASVDDVATKLAADGSIEYRRPDLVPHEHMAALIGEADIVLDQFTLGSYGVVAVEAMAMGRVVVGHIPDHVRARAPGLPIVEATVQTLGSVLVELVGDRERSRQAAALGPEFVRHHHDGTRAASVLADDLGCSATVPRR